MTKFDYTTLKEQLTHKENVELSTNVNVALDRVIGYTVNDPELPTLFFDEYNRIEAETTRDYLENNHRTDLVNRKILQIWFENDCKKEITDYIYNKLGLLNNIDVYVDIAKHHEDTPELRLNIIYEAELYFEELMKIFGLFPNEFVFFKEHNTLKCQIFINRIVENDRMLRRCEYE